MATWKPAPSVPTQAAGGDSPITGKFPGGEAIGQIIEVAPSPPWRTAPALPTIYAGSIGYPL